jgi:pimeloyl-ACP methyl ester carboxylesterase
MSGRVSVRLADGWQRHVDPVCLAGWQPRPFDLGGGTTDVVTMGEGPALLLLPPLPGFKEAWIGVAHRLAARFRVVTFDLRARFAGRPTWDALLADLERVAATFAPERAAVMGHSLGGALAQRWTIAHPDRVAALILSSSFARVGTRPGHWWKRYVEQSRVLLQQRWLPERVAAPLAQRDAARGAWVYDARCDARILAFVRHAIRTLPLDVARRAVHLAFAHDTTQVLSRIACPTLVVAGECETAWAREASDALAAAIPGAERRVSPGVSHLHPLSGAPWLAETAGGWIAARWNDP